MRFVVKLILSFTVVISAVQASNASIGFDEMQTCQPNAEAVVVEQQTLPNQAFVAQLGTEQSVEPREQYLALVNPAQPGLGVSVPANVPKARAVAAELMEKQQPAEEKNPPINVPAVCAVAVFALAVLWGALWSGRRPTR